MEITKQEEAEFRERAPSWAKNKFQEFCAYAAKLDEEARQYEFLLAGVSCFGWECACSQSLGSCRPLQEGEKDYRVDVLDGSVLALGQYRKKYACTLDWEKCSRERRIISPESLLPENPMCIA